MPNYHLTRQPERPGEVLQGMDPLIHPLLAEHAVREYARESLWIQAADGNTAMRAQHLRLRAIESGNSGRYLAALADLDEALKLQPKVLAWQIDRAGMLSKLGRTADADALYRRLRQAAPGDDYLRNSLAVHSFAEGRFAEAEALFRAVKPEDANQPYEAIFAHLSGLRQRTGDSVWLRQHRVGTAGWPAPIQRYLLGEIDRAALLQAARDTFDLRTTEQQCEAYFSLGEAALAAGDVETARREFENCVQSGIVGFIEYGLAKRELERLQMLPSAGEPKSEPVAPAAGNGGSDEPAGEATTG